MDMDNNVVIVGEGVYKRDNGNRKNTIKKYFKELCTVLVTFSVSILEACKSSKSSVVRHLLIFLYLTWNF